MSRVIYRDLHQSMGVNCLSTVFKFTLIVPLCTSAGNRSNKDTSLFLWAFLDLVRLVLFVLNLTVLVLLNWIFDLKSRCIIAKWCFTIRLFRSSIPIFFHKNIITYCP